MDEKAEALFTADILKQLSSSNWKERLEGTQKMTDVSKPTLKITLQLQIVVQFWGLATTVIKIMCTDKSVLYMLLKSRMPKTFEVIDFGID